MKQARQVPVEAVEAFLLPRPGAHPGYFVLQQHGAELLCVFRGFQNGAEVLIEDDVFYQACCNYLKERGVVFETPESATLYAQERGLIDFDDQEA